MLFAIRRPLEKLFTTESTGSVVVRITEASVHIGGFISCSPRTGIGEGEYRPVR